MARVVQALGLQLAQIRYAQTLDNGPIFITLLLSSRQDVLACQPNLQALKDLRTCAALVSVEETVSNPHVEVRAFGPHLGFDEDPVTGSLNASVAQWLIDAGIAPPAYIATQGTCIGRDGKIYIERDTNGTFWVGGESVTCIDGEVKL